MTDTKTPVARSGPEVVHLDVDQRAERGRAARRAVPRSGLAQWEPPPGRPPALELLQAQETTRLADLVPIRRERMSASPFAFYRGAAVVMASDLASGPRTGLTAQCCGDAHLANFGGFASPERELVFDINDFDETHPGPFEWDVKRLVASFEIAARARGFSPKLTRDIVVQCASRYRTAMREFA
jgi:hypothetical protein